MARHPDRLVIDVAPRSRVVPGILALLMFAGTALSLLRGAPLFSSTQVLRLSLGVLCLIAALYDERWTFDRLHRAMFRKVGLPFLSLESRVEYRDIERVVLSGYVVEVSRRTGVAADPRVTRVSWQSYASLHVETKQGKRYKIEQARGRRAFDLVRIGKSVAERASLPLADRIVCDRAGSR